MTSFLDVELDRLLGVAGYDSDYIERTAEILSAEAWE